MFRASQSKSAFGIFSDFISKSEAFLDVVHKYLSEIPHLTSLTSSEPLKQLMYQIVIKFKDSKSVPL